ncbi:MAG: transporter substrate-binding domain-containing protein, partial [Variovorax paradoxus]
MTSRLRPSPLFSSRIAIALAAVLGLGASAAHADATLDRIKQRGKVAIGVVVGGGPFGSIDPATQQLVGWNPDLARDLAKQLGAEAELVQVQPSNRVQFLQSGKVDLLIASMEYNADRGEIL